MAGKYAVVKDNFVLNIIVCDADIVDAMQEQLNCDSLVDAVPYGLCIGDFWNSTAWTRNIDGVQTVLEEQTPQQQSDYNGLWDLIAAQEEALKEGVDSIA